MKPVAWHIEGCEGECFACLIEREVKKTYGNQGLDFLLRNVQTTADQLRAENARLREALEKLASVEGNGVARLALATKEQS